MVRRIQYKRVPHVFLWKDNVEYELSITKLLNALRYKWNLQMIKTIRGSRVVSEGNILLDNAHAWW